MAKKNIITADQVQVGDTIRVTREWESDGRKQRNFYEGVVATLNEGVARVASGYNLYAHERQRVIQLLDRPKPKPKLTVPTLPNAVVKYTFLIGSAEEPRTAIRDRKGTWRCYQDNGLIGNIRHDDADFEALVSANKGFEIVFGGAL